MPAHPGALAQVYASGSSILINSQAFNNIDSGAWLKYQVSQPTHQVWDPTYAVIVYVDGTPQAVGTYTLNRLYGTITFNTPLTSGNVVTAKIKYLPMTAVAGANSAEGSFTRASLDMTTFASAGNTERTGGLGDASGSIGRFYQADGLFFAAVQAGTPLVVGYWSNAANANPDWRAWAFFNKSDIKADPASLIGQTVEWVGTTDADGRQVSFGA